MISGPLSYRVFREPVITRSLRNGAPCSPVSFPAAMDRSHKLISATYFQICFLPGYLSNRPQVSMVYRLINHLGCWQNTKRIRKFTNSFRVLPTSQVVYQPITHRNRLVVYCFLSPRNVPKVTKNVL